MKFYPKFQRQYPAEASIEEFDQFLCRISW